MRLPFNIGDLECSLWLLDGWLLYIYLEYWYIGVFVVLGFGLELSLLQCFLQV